MKKIGNIRGYFETSVFEIRRVILVGFFLFQWSYCRKDELASLPGPGYDQQWHLDSSFWLWLLLQDTCLMVLYSCAGQSL